MMEKTHMKTLKDEIAASDAAISEARNRLTDLYKKDLRELREEVNAFFDSMAEPDEADAEEWLRRKQGLLPERLETCKRLLFKAAGLMDSMVEVENDLYERMVDQLKFRDTESDTHIAEMVDAAAELARLYVEGCRESRLKTIEEILSGIRNLLEREYICLKAEYLKIQNTPDP